MKPPSRQPGPDWTREAAEIKGSKGARWTHTSGWIIAHCGHPTANWPYYLVDPAHPTDITVTHNGKGFARLDVAVDAVGGILDGSLLPTDDRCNAGTRRVLGAGALERVPLEVVAPKAGATRRVALIACGASKRDVASPARDLYTGSLFRDARGTRSMTERLSRNERHLTPVPFARWLVQLASGCRPTRGPPGRSSMTELLGRLAHPPRAARG